MSIPFYGKEFTFTQPDGGQLKVRGWGDQHQATFETLEGFTVVKDPTTGFYQYATVSNDGEALEPIGVRPGMLQPKSLGLVNKLRISLAATKAMAELGVGLPRSRSRWEVRRERVRNQLRFASMAPLGMQLAPPKRKTAGDYLGLCLLIQFPDVPGTIAQHEVEAFCNQRGYTGFGNNGSVYDYFYENSSGKLRYTNVVVKYYTAKHPRSYYTNPQVRQPQRAWELIKEALVSLKAQGFDASKLTSDGEDYVYALNVFYAGGVVNNWPEGLWPHAFHLATPFELSPGKQIYDYQITNMGSELTLGTFCHENGHMVCDFPDLYDYGYESRGVGAYCLMCGGGNADPKNPTHVGAYLKYQAGWAELVTKSMPGLSAKLSAGRNEFFIHEKNSSEYFIIENRFRRGRDSALPGSGLAIWHVDEIGSNNNEHMTSSSHYECSLVQADGRFDLERGLNDGDADDLFHAGGSNRFAVTTQPSSKWWDKTNSGLEVHEISQVGELMRFSANVSP